MKLKRFLIAMVSVAVVSVVTGFCLPGGLALSVAPVKGGAPAGGPLH